MQQSKPHSELRSMVYDHNGIGASIDRHPFRWSLVCFIILFLLVLVR